MIEIALLRVKSVVGIAEERSKVRFFFLSVVTRGPDTGGMKVSLCSASVGLEGVERDE